jgi:hypothetical protein
MPPEKNPEFLERKKIICAVSLILAADQTQINPSILGLPRNNGVLFKQS